ncbi:phosphodiester glycosidase family protein [Streptomyces sp. ST1015]|uniref:phosphodiester glycosidase family protein n=1 Tax=Streptomyces sp. ST1015 TaxID=1848900 RepID=UPI000DDC092B|nr:MULTISPECIES: phosphodiester glycosidase family protein [unclassified Streptomyces]QZZ26396.1 phosphodiester glycosidase family protein [Streptomyces sp. ST1015]
MRRLTTFLTVCATVAGAAFAGAPPADAAVAQGVTYRQYDIRGAAGTAHAHVLTVDLTDPHVRLGLLYPGVVAGRAPVSRLADAQGALAGVNGDFFNITETQHPGVPATGASVGPAVADGEFLKGAVPDGQRFGPTPPASTTTRAVVGVDHEGRARLGTLPFTATTNTGLPVSGLNQYALAQNSVGAYTSRWGDTPRTRATCGTDLDRAAPCATDTYEVTLRGDRVISGSPTPGAGPISPGTTVLLGREKGANQLRALIKGQYLSVRYPYEIEHPAFRFAVGGYPILTAGRPLPGLDTRTSAVRTAIGISGDGHHVHLFALDGATAYRTGLTVAELAQALRKLGATEGFSLDGGGSTTLVLRQAGQNGAAVLNHPSGGAERPVPNGVGVFQRP